MAGGGAGGLPLGHEQAEAIGQVEVAANRVQRFGVDGGHVDGVADFALGEVVDQQLDGFDGDLRLGLFGAGAEVRRAEDVGHAEERAVGAGLFDEDVEGDAADLAALESFDEGFFVVDAAAGGVDEAHAGLHQVDGFACR